MEDVWSSAVSTALKSPPAIFNAGGRDGNEVQKGRWIVLSAGAYILRMFICGECGGVMVISRMRWSVDSNVSAELMCGAIRVAT